MPNQWILRGSLFLLVVGLATVLSVGSATGSNSAAPSIEGTYMLESRELPNGTKEVPPAVVGLLTYTQGYRNFNVYWKYAKGKAFSISSVATYKLNEKEYSEKSIYYMVNDEIGGKGISYDLSGATGSSPVSMKEGRVEFQLPLFGEPKVVFSRLEQTQSNNSWVSLTRRSGVTTSVPASWESPASTPPEAAAACGG